MISTVTTSAVTTMIGFGMALGLVAVITLIAFLGVRELATASRGGTQRLLAKSLDIGIVPLIIAFAMIIAMEMVKILA
ncbi:hypothetical protein ES706_04937 [subsurface metagenome]